MSTALSALLVSTALTSSYQGVVTSHRLQAAQRASYAWQIQYPKSVSCLRRRVDDRKHCLRALERWALEYGTFTVPATVLLSPEGEMVSYPETEYPLRSYLLASEVPRMASEVRSLSPIVAKPPPTRRAVWGWGIAAGVVLGIGGGLALSY